MKLEEISDIFPLTEHQILNCGTYEKNMGNGVYHENLIFYLSGDIDADIFRKSWEYTIQKHDIFRTGFYRMNGDWVQVVKETISLNLECLDWSGYPSEKITEETEKLIINDKLTPYNMEKAPLMRMFLIRTGKTEWQFIWNFHHVIMDGWAFAVSFGDMLDFYRKLMNGQTSVKINEVDRYKDYYLYRLSREREDERKFWKKYLDGADFSEQMSEIKDDLKPDNPINHTRLDYKIPQYYERLNALMKKYGFTMNAVFQSVFTLLLYRVSGGKRDIINGQVAADRGTELYNANNRVGMYVNNLPLRYTVNESESFTKMVEKVQNNILSVFGYVSSSEAEISSYVGHDGKMFNEMLVFKNIPISADPFYGLPFSLEGSSLESNPDFDFILLIWPDENLELKYIFNNRKYRVEDIRKYFYDDLKTVLDCWLAHEDCTVADIMKYTDEYREDV